MLLRLSNRLDDAATASHDLPSWVTRTQLETRIVGDDSLDRDTYVSVADDGIWIATDLAELITGRHGAGEPSPFGVSHVLGTGFVGLPDTVFDRVWWLGAGDEMVVGQGEASRSVSVTCDYPWVNSKSRQDQQPSTERLLSLIVASVERRLEECGRSGLLMMSSGKDSTGLAVAIAELGYDIPAVTYRSTADNREPEDAARLGRRLGLRHETVEMPTDPEIIRKYMGDYFASAVIPCADHAIIPFIVSVGESGVTDGGILDGGGNDGYMGYFASQRRRKKRLLQIRGRALRELVVRTTRHDAPINYLARGRSALAWPGRYLRHHEMRRIYRDAIDPAERWRQADRELAGQSDVDRAMRNMVKHIEGSRTPDKVRTVAQVYDMAPVLPYCDRDIADYFFHLPQDQRFDASARHEKVLLTQMLRETVDYDPDDVASGFFEFDGAPFFIANADYVKEEVLSCSLWQPSIERYIADWLEELPRRPFLFHALLSIFMVSGWHNHSPYVIR